MSSHFTPTTNINTETSRISLKYFSSSVAVPVVFDKTLAIPGVVTPYNSILPSQSAVKDSGTSFDVTVDSLLINNTRQETGATIYRMGSKEAPAQLGRDLPKGDIDCSGWVAANTLDVMAAINKNLGNVYDMNKMRAILNNVAADQIRIVAEETGLVIDNAKIRSGKGLYPGMFIGVGGMDDGRYRGIGHIGQVVEENGQLFVSDSKHLGSQNGVQLSPLKEWLYNTKGEPLYAVDPFLLTTPQGRTYIATRLPMQHPIAWQSRHHAHYSSAVFPAASPQYASQTPEQAVAVAPAMAQKNNVQVQPVKAYGTKTLVQETPIKTASVSNKIKPVATNVAIGVASNIAVKSTGAMIAAHFGLAALVATAPVALLPVIAVATGIGLGVLASGVASFGCAWVNGGSAGAREQYWKRKAFKAGITWKKFGWIALGAMSLGVLSGAAEAATHFGIFDHVTQHINAGHTPGIGHTQTQHVTIAHSSGHPGVTSTPQSLTSSVAGSHPAIASAAQTLSPDDIKQTAATIRYDDVQSSRIFATAHGNVAKLKQAYALLQNGTNLAIKDHLTTMAQHLFANKAYADYWGVGTTRNIAAALSDASRAGFADHGYGVKLLKLVHHAARPLAQVTMNRVLGSSLEAA